MKLHRLCKFMMQQWQIGHCSNRSTHLWSGSLVGCDEQEWWMEDVQFRYLLWIPLCASCWSVEDKNNLSHHLYLPKQDPPLPCGKVQQSSSLCCSGDHWWWWVHRHGMEVARRDLRHHKEVWSSVRLSYATSWGIPVVSLRCHYRVRTQYMWFLITCKFNCKHQ